MARNRAPGDLVGHNVLDEEGNNVGKIKQVYLDDETNEPSWVSVHTGLFGKNETLVPLQGSRPKEEDIQIPFAKATVKDAPNIDADRHISPEEERLVRDYYAHHGGIPTQGGRTPTTAAPVEGAVPPRQAGETTDDAAMTRSEEQVDIGVERRKAGEARLHKYVETEQFDETVPLHREELQVERRPVNDPSQVPGTRGMEEEEESFTLYEERPVVSKEQVPVEEVHVRKRDVTREEHVQGERSRERIELEDEDGDSPNP